MRKKIATLTLTLGMLFCTTMPTMAQTREIDFPDFRIDNGTYYDYMVVETADGNEWLLGDEPDSKYLDNNGNAIFQDGQAVCILFNTNGTINYLEDDVILDVVATNTSK